MIRKGISDPRPPGSWLIKGTVESLLRVDLPVPLMHHDPNDLGSLILFRIIPKERTLRLGRFNLKRQGNGATRLDTISTNFDPLQLATQSIADYKNGKLHGKFSDYTGNAVCRFARIGRKPRRTRTSACNGLWEKRNCGGRLAHSRLAGRRGKIHHFVASQRGRSTALTMPSFQDFILICYAQDLLDVEEFILLYHLNSPRRVLDESFDLEELTEDQCKAEFRFIWHLKLTWAIYSWMVFIIKF